MVNFYYIIISNRRMPLTLFIIQGIIVSLDH